ncbi:MAG: 23S rRNA pseudouridine(1911/1915/1917) synthase RluD [Gammaproteobacteria bacterium]|nr:23S rRNA pseudouridine(1911/1915/1917) synthase RluD [Gammaproteobacteria bacterium]
MGDDHQLSTVIPASLAGLRLDAALSRIFPEYSRTRLQECIRSHEVLVNGRASRPRDIVSGGERIEGRVRLHEESPLLPEEIDLEIVYEDRSLLVINKPAGLVVHPGAGNPAGTLANALLHHDPGLSAIPRAGIVHRLDKDTSGLLLIARQLQSHRALVEMLQQRRVSRRYAVLVHGQVIAGGTVDAPVGRHPVDRKKMAVRSGGKPAITHYRVSQRLGPCTLLEARLETGRTHQIRVHMAHLGFPVVGDPVYGRKIRAGGDCASRALAGFPRQALHASHLELTHPEAAKTCKWSAPLPQDFRQLLDTLSAHAHAAS